MKLAKFHDSLADINELEDLRGLLLDEWMLLGCVEMVAKENKRLWTKGPADHFTFLYTNISMGSHHII